VARDAPAAVGSHSPAALARIQVANSSRMALSSSLMPLA
jgi:hypothetical protein